MKYSSFPAPAPGWQMGAPLGMGVSIQYNSVVVLLRSKIIILQVYLNLWLLASTIV